MQQASEFQRNVYIVAFLICVFVGYFGYRKWKEDRQLEKIRRETPYVKRSKLTDELREAILNKKVKEKIKSTKDALVEEERKLLEQELEEEKKERDLKERLKKG
jgi:hypothetical protein